MGDRGNMKKFVFFTLLLFLFSACTAPASTQIEDEATLTVFAAASMSDVLSEIAEVYTAKHPDVNIVFNFDSSGTLRTQIMEGANADMFISAATREMDQLEEANFILNDTRVDVLENQAVLVTSAENASAIRSFSDMADALVAGNGLMTMGNMDVPAGRYAQEILQYFGLDHEILARTGVITYASNVRTVATQVREGSAGFGIVYLTDAVGFDLYVIDIATPEMTGRIIYPAAVLSGSQNAARAQSFLDFLQNDTAAAIFLARGFLPLR